MEYNLNKIQRSLLKKAKTVGYLTEDDFIQAYACQITIKANIKRFIALKLIEWNEDGLYYKYIGDDKK